MGRAIGTARHCALIRFLHLVESGAVIIQPGGLGTQSGLAVEAFPVQQVNAPGAISQRTRNHAWNTVEKLRDADAIRMYSSHNFSGTRSKRLGARRGRENDAMQVEWMSSRNGTAAPISQNDPMANMTAGG